MTGVPVGTGGSAPAPPSGTAGSPAASPMSSLHDGYRALVVGASGAIGGALLAALRADRRCAAALGLSRGGFEGTPPLDVTQPGSIAAAAEALQPQAPFDLVVCATGVLHAPCGHPPEKRLADIDAQALAELFAVNATGPALLLRHFHALLPLQRRCLLAVLSARVGSIGDNRTGGWYAYRASKAALNMLLRSAAVEVARRRPQAVLVALHPGTVRSRLSAPIVGDAARAVEPAVAAARLLAVLDGLPAEGASGGFRAWDGTTLPW